MRILHTVEFYEPFKGGSQEVVRQLSERMVAKGHDVAVATGALPDRKFSCLNGVKIKEFNVTDNEVRGYHGETEVYKDFLIRSDYDVVMNYAAQQWASDLFFDVIDSVKAKKVLVPCGFSNLYNPDYKEYFSKMPEILSKYDATVYLSSSYRDIDFAKKHHIKNCHIIPNGASEDEFSKDSKLDVRKELGLAAGTKLISQAGCSFTGEKGQLESIKIFSASNLRNTCLLLVGNVVDKESFRVCKRYARLFNINPKNVLAGRKIVIQTWDREKTVATFKQSDVFLFPSNIEASPIVLYEACAAKTPFLSTDVGNSVEIAKWTGGGMILPTKKDHNNMSHAEIKGSAKMLEELTSDPDAVRKLGANGHKSWLKKFTWNKIADQYLNIYERILTK